MTVSKFMVAGKDATEVQAIDILDKAYRTAGFLSVGTDKIGLEDTPAEAHAVEGIRPGVRTFRVTVEEVQ